MKSGSSSSHIMSDLGVGDVKYVVRLLPANTSGLIVRASSRFAVRGSLLGFILTLRLLKLLG
ncbi:MAG: hypothetical protein QXV95_07640 [Sulfolobales archaeon]